MTVTFALVKESDTLTNNYLSFSYLIVALVHLQPLEELIDELCSFCCPLWKQYSELCVDFLPLSKIN